MPFAWTMKPGLKILALCALLAILLASGLLFTQRAALWRTKAASLARKLLPAHRASAAGGAYASSDHFLAALEIERPSQTLVVLMAELAADETALFVGPADDPRFMQTLLTFSYLSWPRQLAALGCRTRAAPSQVLYRPNDGVSVARAFFYLQPPPSRLAAQSCALGPKLKLVQVAKGEEWTSYCSQ